LNHPTAFLEPAGLDTLQPWLQAQLSANRYDHTQGVVEAAQQLARRLDISNDSYHSITLAAWLHDACKLMGSANLAALADALAIELTEADRACPATWHAWVAPAFVSREWGITDPVCLDAIRYHTTGRKAMTLTEGILYVADKIERRTRNQTQVVQWYEAANWPSEGPLHPDDLWRLVRVITQTTLTFLIQGGQPIHPHTVSLWNALTTQNAASQNVLSQPYRSNSFTCNPLGGTPA
jgi:predicted HD superfamily hydrolase involved in NAD metabolism